MVELFIISVVGTRVSTVAIRDVETTNVEALTNVNLNEEQKHVSGRHFIDEPTVQLRYIG